MKTVEAKDIREIIGLSEEGMIDTVGYDRLDGMDEDSIDKFYAEDYLPNNPDCPKLGSDPGWWFDVSMTDEWHGCWAAFFNSSEELNDLFWKEMEDMRVGT